MFQTELRRIGVPESIIDDITRNFAGCNVYIPTVCNRKGRNAEIFAEFNGKNYRELAVKHSLTFQSIHRIVRAMRSNARTK